jgi:threonine dehydratase
MPVEDMLRRVLRAPVYDVARETPLEAAPQLSARVGSTVLLKREDLQPVFSFKLRGAYNRMVQLEEAERRAGVIASSAGNHAQGVALAARRLGVDALIVMPRTTPPIKVDAVRRLGARALLHGDAYDAAFQRAQALTEETGRTFIHPYDDLDVIAGQGTIALELLRQKPSPLDAVFVCVGGGGLIAGISAVLAQVAPETRIIGVEPADAASLTAALAAGTRVRLPDVGIFADGVAVARVGAEPFEIARRCVHEMVTVEADEVCAGIKDIFTDTRSIAEPAGALAVAGAKKWLARSDRRGLTVAATVSGANLNFDRLRYIAERTELGEGREALFAATIPERPGSFEAFCRALGRHRSITEFNYRYAGPGEAHVFVGIALGGAPSEKTALLDELRSRGIEVLDLSDDEMAKLHLRHLVGGRAALPLRVPGAAGRSPRLPRAHERRMEHQPLSLPEPRRRVRAGPGRGSSSGRGPGRVASSRLGARLPVRVRAGEPSLPAVPPRLTGQGPGASTERGRSDRRPGHGGTEAAGRARPRRLRRLGAEAGRRAELRPRGRALRAGRRSASLPGGSPLRKRGVRPRAHAPARAGGRALRAGRRSASLPGGPPLRKRGVRPRAAAPARAGGRPLRAGRRSAGALPGGPPLRKRGVRPRRPEDARPAPRLRRARRLRAPPGPRARRHLRAPGLSGWPHPLRLRPRSLLPRRRVHASAPRDL